MPLDLPEPSSDRLEHAPLSLVVCQVRHEQSLAASDPGRAMEVHSILRDDYPLLQEQASQQITVTASPVGVQTLPSTPARGWRMRSEDEVWNAVITTEFFSLETTKYQDWPDFRRRIEALSRAVAKTIAPALEARMGLRFINRIAHPDVAAPQEWRGLIAPEFLGPVVHETLGRSVTSTQQVIQLDDGAGYNALFRHGAIEDDPPGNEAIYMLDEDCYVQRGKAFDVDDLLTAVEDLHTFALQLFQAAITPDLYAFLKGSSS
jgi:uncharacterized protein (TIGR04255 family)